MISVRQLKLTYKLTKDYSEPSSLDASVYSQSQTWKVERL